LKKRYVIIGLLASTLAFGQQPSGYRKKKISRSDVQAMFSYYTQDNDHSAVTGGKGTEDLQVYAQDYSFTWLADSVHQIHLELGADIITSPSTDNIDDVVSSASKKDFRVYSTIGYNRALKKGITLGITSGVSLESDYLSIGAGLHISKQSEDQTREWSIAFQSFFDDLRWLNSGKPRILIYPEELRTREWFDIYRRTSYNLSLSFYQTLNRRMSLGVYPGVAFQHGLLSTPFHRVYFSDSTVKVENLPRERFKVPLGTQLNMFLGKMWIIRTYYRFYWDTFGIVVHSLNIETPMKVSGIFTLSPFIRVYTQTQANYFKRYADHNPNQRYYTSDYDLSGFESYSAGMSMRILPFRKKANGWSFHELEMRYVRYKRSDGLLAHTITTFINLNAVRLKNN
jgi:hypothetical protein